MATSLLFRHGICFQEGENDESTQNDQSTESPKDAESSKNIAVDEVSMNRQCLALTTGQAAMYCFVTPGTMVNWIKADLLPAQRTGGGQYRILLKDLRIFMHSRGMSTELLDAEPEDRPMCWQVFAGDARRKKACDGCLVKFLGVLNCFRLMGMNPEEERYPEGCEACEYYQRWSNEPDQDAFEQISGRATAISEKEDVKP
ncbi:MAG: hypothetical protein HOC74_36810 [Gemmatimonadetes bacterium]|nr:hypothetical protein [Gemmatimonadota bacterium]